jgi:hypothetical protein
MHKTCGSAIPANLEVPRQFRIGLGIFVGQARPLVASRFGLRLALGFTQRAQDDLAKRRRGRTVSTALYTVGKISIMSIVDLLKGGICQ